MFSDFENEIMERKIRFSENNFEPVMFWLVVLSPLHDLTLAYKRTYLNLIFVWCLASISTISLMAFWLTKVVLKKFYINHSKWIQRQKNFFKANKYLFFQIDLNHFIQERNHTKIWQQTKSNNKIKQDWFK